MRMLKVEHHPAAEPAPRIAPREVRYEAVMRRSAEINAAAEREPK